MTQRQDDSGSPKMGSMAGRPTNNSLEAREGAITANRPQKSTRISTRLRLGFC